MKWYHSGEVKRTGSSERDRRFIWIIPLIIVPKVGIGKSKDRLLVAQELDWHQLLALAGSNTVQKTILHVTGLTNIRTDKKVDFVVCLE